MGPVITYVAKCDAVCADADKTTLKWVKFDESGYDVDTKTSAAIAMISNNNTWTTTVPSSLAPGNYVFRHEVIALHGAEKENGAQNYPQCLNIEVTGSGTENPEGVLGTELYKSTDPGILFNPYRTITSYTIPGPALFGSSGASKPFYETAFWSFFGCCVVRASCYFYPCYHSAAPVPTVTHAVTSLAKVTLTVTELVDPAPTTAVSTKAAATPMATGSTGRNGVPHFA